MHLSRLIACLLASFWMIQTAFAQPLSTPDGSIYRAPLEESPVSLDPAIYSDIYSITVSNQIFDGLVKFDTYLKPVPALAKRWIIDRSGTIYTFQLRQDVTFHDGTPMTADAVARSFLRLLTPNSPVASQLLAIKGAQAYLDGEAEHVEGITANSTYTLRIELAYAYAPFLSILAMPNMVVVAEASSAGEPFSPIGTGPFVFSEWVKNKRISLRKNNNYYLQAPMLDGVDFIIYENQSIDDIIEDFKHAKLDHAILPNRQNVNPHKLTTADGRAAEIVTRAGLNVIYLGYNQRNPVLANKKVRQAIGYALDTESVVSENHSGSAIPAKSLIPPGLAGHDPDYPGYAYNPQKARRLLAAAGFDDPADLPVIELWTVSKSTHIHHQLQQYRDQLEQIGIKSELHVADKWQEYIEAIHNGEADIYMMGWYVDYADSDNIMTPLVQSSSVTNRADYANSAVDDLIELARKTVDYDQRVEIYRDLNRIVMEDMPLIPLYHKSYNCAVQPWVRGLELTRLGDSHLRFSGVSIDASGPQAQPLASTSP